MVVKMPKNKYLVYIYTVYLNDVPFVEFARVERAAEQARELAAARPDAHITVMREFDWEFTVLTLWDKLIGDNMWVQARICRFKGHMWDSDRPQGGIHEQNICWRCNAIKPETTH